MGSPFEGSPRAGAAEYVYRGGDVCIYFPKQHPNYQTLTKYPLHRTKILTVLCIA